MTGSAALNGICPYFTMYPLDFPLTILKRRARKGDIALDPFCGRGTTNFAARLVGLHSVGVDASPVAGAIAAAKLVAVTVGDILAEARQILAGGKVCYVPQGEFWQVAFHSDVLDAICRWREALRGDCSTAPRIALRGVILGALHGPKQKTFPSYFSNQSPRTFAPKPAYATRYWRDKGLIPEPMDVLEVIARRAKRYYGAPLDETMPYGTGVVRIADSRVAGTLDPEISNTRFNWVITSPPYYGMRTYIPDQWLRHRFVGGPNYVEYASRDQMVHSSPTDFTNDLRQVWWNTAEACADDATMVIRFGGISDRRVNPLEIVKRSLVNSGWRIKTICGAGSAMAGKRQANAFLQVGTQVMMEYDLWLKRN